MKRISTLSILVFITLGLFAQVQNPSYEEMLKTLLTHSVNEIQVQEINPKDSSIIFLDARERKEFDVSHIKNAIWVGYNDFEVERIQGIAKDKKLIVYCSVGYRSEKVAEQLIKLGYQNVSNLYGSIFEWVNQGNEVFNLNKEKTLKIHAYDSLWGVWLNRGEKVYR